MADDVLKLSSVVARTQIVVDSQEVTTHEGDGALYTVIRVRGEGPMTSDDPRMEGIFRADAVMLVDDRGQGVGRDDWTLVDAATGRVKARGTAHGTINGSNPIRAVSIGMLEDGTRFFANARVEVPPFGAEGPIVIEYGGPAWAIRATARSRSPGTAGGSWTHVERRDRHKKVCPSRMATGRPLGARRYGVTSKGSGREE